MNNLDKKYGVKEINKFKEMNERDKREAEQQRRRYEEHNRNSLRMCWRLKQVLLFS